MINEKRERRRRRHGEARCGKEIPTTCGIKVSSIASGEGLTSDDPFFSRAQPYA